MSNISLVLNARDRNITYKGLKKDINDDFWMSNIDPLLTPLWNSDKDLLDIFVYREDGTYVIQRSKYKRNHKTKISSWVPYEFDPKDCSDAELYSVSDLYESLYEKYIEYRDISERQYDIEVRRKIEDNNVLSWSKLKLVRKFLLDDSDWTQLSDNGLNEEEKILWQKYRNFIRNNKKAIDCKGEENGQAPNPYDVVYPITPTEYLERKSTGLTALVKEEYGEQGNDCEYLESDYHFWRMGMNTLKHFSSKMSLYIALTTLTNGNTSDIGSVKLKNYRSVFGVPGGRSSSEEVERPWLDDLLNKIELGEI